MTQLNKQAYQQLIDGDIEFLNQLPNTQERRHIQAVLEEHVRMMYPDRKTYSSMTDPLNNKI